MPRVTSSDGVEFHLDGADVARMLVAAKGFDKKLATSLRRNIRNAGKEVLGYVRDEVLSGSYKNQVGLRAQIADGLKVQVSTSQRSPGVRIAATSSKLPENKKTLLYAWQSRRGWRHPVFGNRNRFVAQKGKPFFYGTIAAHRSVVDGAVADAMQEAGEAMSREVNA